MEKENMSVVFRNCNSHDIICRNTLLITSRGIWVTMTFRLGKACLSFSFPKLCFFYRLSSQKSLSKSWLSNSDFASNCALCA